MEREENGLLLLQEELAKKVWKFERQYKISKVTGVNKNISDLLELSDCIDKIKLHIKNNKYDTKKVVKLYNFLISKDVELVNLAKQIIYHA
jgi:hypothetical protein